MDPSNGEDPTQVGNPSFEPIEAILVTGDNSQGIMSLEKDSPPKAITERLQEKIANLSAECLRLRQELEKEQSKRIFEIAKEKSLRDYYTVRRKLVKKYNWIFRVCYITKYFFSCYLRYQLLEKNVIELWKYSKYPSCDLCVEQFPVGRFKDDPLPSLAIVTPSFNQGHFIEQTIKSVVEAGYPSLSYAVIDGGSKDDSVSVIDRYRNRITYAISERDNGQTDAIVKGFAHVSGNIMAYLNADDVLMPGALRFVGEYFNQHPEVDVIYGHRVVIDENNQEIGRWVVPNHCNESNKRFDYIPQETMFWRESIYRKCGGFNPTMRFAMDWDFILRLQECGARFKRVPYFLGCFRSHSDQKSQTIINTVGEEESKALRIRELGSDESTWQIYHYSVLYSLKAKACETLLKWNIRF